MENEDEAGKDRDSGPAADSTQFHSQVTLETIPPRGDRLRSDTNHGIGRSIRMRKRSPRGSLASRIALPVLIAVLATCIVATLLVMQWLFVVQTRELRSAAGGSAYALGRLGGVILEKREAFLRKHPDYPTLSRWRTGDHWLFEGGFIDAETWREATGFNLDEIAPVSVLEQAMSKAALSRYAAEASFGQPRLAAVAILNPDGSIMTSNQNPAWALDLASLMAGIADHPRAAPGTGSSFVEYLNDAKPEPLVRGVCKLMSKEHSERLLGTAVVLVGTGIYNLDRRSYILMSGGILLLQLIGVGSVCWLAVRRMSVSMRRLVTDMQAMTEGDYSRRSNLADADEIGLLAMAFNSLAERLRVARANERENSRLENDLAVARNIQNNLLPPQTPRVRGFDIHTAYRPAREIGGDYFDFLPVDNQHIGMV
ncbi:MAG: HAMP domain-containing protein, partial [Planctomycetes bacterium]|nr:HAMP domain-containing protein [Planctomycetota bacterium]